MRRKIQLVLFSLIGVITVLHYLGSIFDWYYTLFWFDIPMHILGGMFIGILFIYLSRVRHQFLETDSVLAYIILGISFTVLIGVLWEFYEFFIDVVMIRKYTLMNAPGSVHFDTLLDLLNDLIGGAIAVSFFACEALGKK